MKRNSNIEFLRILSILFIVLSHYSVHNGISNEMLPLGFNRFILEISVLGNIGSIIFVIITGFFSINQEKPFKFKKIILLYFEVLFYSIFVYFIMILFGLEKFSYRLLINCLFPLSYKNYWFISVYFLLYIFAPYINVLLNNLDKKNHFTLIFISIFIFSILNMLFRNDYYCNELIQFFIFYIIGAYLGKYKDNFFLNKKNGYIGFFISSFVLVFSVIFIDCASLKYDFLIGHSLILFSRTSIVSILFSAFLFSIFYNKREKNNSTIILIGSCTLGVYLISDHFLIRKVLWTNLLHVDQFIHSNYLLFHMIFSVIFIFILCILIEYIRKNTIEKIIIKYLLPFVEKIQIKINSIYNNVLKKYFNL